MLRAIDTRRACGAALLVGLSAGCVNKDARDVDKIRYHVVHQFAEQALRDAGHQLDSLGSNYDLMIFSLEWHDISTGRFYREHLYDFLKITEEPGPTRFVVAFDIDTGRMFLRTDLRSRVNLDRLPPPVSQPATATAPG